MRVSICGRWRGGRRDAAATGKGFKERRSEDLVAEESVHIRANHAAIHAHGAVCGLYATRSCKRRERRRPIAARVSRVQLVATDLEARPSNQDPAICDAALDADG